jgi:hypothetical protein
MKNFSINLLIAVGIISLLVLWYGAAQEIQAWEVANNYPYGKLCDVFNNCK